jgi:crossover junction endodeoxyribonuclease RuvC
LVNIIGIDPGAHGAVARLRADPASGKIAWAEASPLQPIPHGSGHVQFDVRDALYVLESFTNGAGDAHVVLERVASMPGQGVASMFSFGMNVGAIQALAITTFPEGIFTYVVPAVWKRHFNLLKQPKMASIDISVQELPNASIPMPVDQRRETNSSFIGMCDALLIAKWKFDMLFREAHK